MFSSLSALTLLAYYTNLAIFIHPNLLPTSLKLENARSMLDQMKQKNPHGKIWKLLEGKLCKMEGKTRRGVEILRDARRRDCPTVDLFSGSKYGSQEAHDRKHESMFGEFAQLQALAVYEMGWYGPSFEEKFVNLIETSPRGQIILGEYFQASETFFPTGEHEQLVACILPLHSHLLHVCRRRV